MQLSPTTRLDLEPVCWFAEPTPEGRRLARRAERRRRLEMLEIAKRDPSVQRMLRAKCARDSAFFFDQFVWTYDPRDREHLPMVLWPIQRAFVAFVEQAITDAEAGEKVEWLCDKSRDVGVTYLCCGIAVHKWLFVPGFKTGFCANLAGMVDTLNKPDSIFEKVRMIIDRLPRWLRPEGYSREDDALVNRITNRENKNAIIGEGGKEAGRGGRSSLYIIDEAAFIDNAQRVHSATSANTRCRGWVSSPNGVGNFFYERRFSGEWRVFSIHWRDHPGRDEAWARETERLITKTTFAREYDLSYAGSVPGLLVEFEWVQSAKQLYRMLPHPTHKAWVAGLDVGAGGDLSVFQPRLGELVPRSSSMQTPNTDQTAQWALALARERCVTRITYDSIGVGEGIKVAFRMAEIDDRISVHACNWGAQPDSGRTWEDGRTSDEIFANQKAELHWLVRERFKKAHELYLHVTQQPGGVPHPQSDCVLLEPNATLEQQLCSVTWQRRGAKIAIESKEALQRRGVKSPDFLEALAYSESEPATVDFATQAWVGPQLASSTPDWGSISTSEW